MTNWSLGHPFAVPGVHRRQRRYRFHRHPRHIGVERFMAGCGLRGAKVPPDALEDIYRCIQRSWKVHRRNQWKEQP